MPEVELRDIRLRARRLVRRAEAGERVTITVAGRPVAALGPISTRKWRRWDDLAHLFARPADPDSARDRELIDDSITDPWSR